jgi:hypothetical protein
VDAGGAEGGAIEAGPGPGPTGSTLHLQVVPAGQIDQLATAPIVSVPGSFGSIAALGRRLVLVSAGVLPGSAAFRTFDKGGQLSLPTYVQTEGSGEVAYTDVAFHQDHFFFAVEKSAPNGAQNGGGSISLVAFDKATTAPVPLQKVFLPSDPRVPPMGTVRDGRVAVAASDSRVAVVWAIGRTLTDQEAVGGYALFACTTP